MTSWQIVRLIDSLTILSKNHLDQIAMFSEISPTEEMCLEFSEAWRFVRTNQISFIPKEGEDLCEAIDAVMSSFGGRDSEFWLKSSLGGKDWGMIRKLATDAREIISKSIDPKEGAT